MQIKDLIPWARKDDPAASGGEAENPVANLQREMNRMFDNFWSAGAAPQAFGGLRGFPVFGEAMPRTDVVETDDGVEVTVELPGMDEKDIEVSLSNDAITVKGEKKIERQEDKKGYYVSERSYGSVFRSIPLPAGIDSDKAEARFRNGVLSVKLPHSAEARSKVKKIAVQTN